jgi:hypothetical protein
MKRESSSRPKLPKISEEMKAWCAALAAEVMDWPQVTTRIFFGFTALYRHDRIFAALPRTRAMETPNSLAFKLESATARLRTALECDPRIGTTTMQAARWFIFELSTDADLHDALEWLGRAYEAAGKRRKNG